MRLVDLKELSEFWGFIDSVVNAGDGVEITVDKADFALSVEAYTLAEGLPAGFTVHSDLDSFMASLLGVMCRGDSNYRVKMLDTDGNPLKGDADTLIEAGCSIVFTLTNEKKAH